MTEKIEAFWVDATADDVARVMRGEKVEARFRDREWELWYEQRLAGWVEGREHQWRSTAIGGRWSHCQVYREPSWWLDKPDPGPGYRLLDKFPDEPKKEGDDWFYAAENRWIAVWNGSDEPQSNLTWYRRRIEPVEPEPKHYVLRVGDTVEGPKGDCIRCVEPGFEQSHYALKAGDTVGTPNGQTITITEKGFEVTQ